VRRHRKALALLILPLLLSACGSGAPDEGSLRDSFAAQLAANEFIRDVQRNGNEITFSGPSPDGRTGSWRVVIDTATVEPNDDPGQPYKGTVLSSWSVDGQPVQPSGRDSNLPIELTSNGLAQDCWALWNATGERWEWE
jgi:hypothetical protein